MPRAGSGWTAPLRVGRRVLGTVGTPKLLLILHTLALLAPLAGAAPAQAQHDQHPMRGMGEAGESAAVWRMPPMPRSMPMLPGLMALEPQLTPYLPGTRVDPASIAAARPHEAVALEDGDTLHLTAGLVRRTINGRTFTMYGYNGQYPGPLIKVAAGAEIVVVFENEIDLPSSVHWHGVRVENRYDGVPGLTQKAVEPGKAFVYRVRFPDAGIYWYHPHAREDIQQDLGLYGNLLVDPPDASYYSPVNREEVLVLDDLLIDEAGLFPYGLEAATHALMGRFGNVFLVNGEPDYALEVSKGEVVRFFLTNVSNTRTFNLSFGGARAKIVGADIGKFEREEWVESVVIAPAQRYIVEVRFEQAGSVALTNRVQAIDHFLATFYPEVDTLGTVTVASEPAEEDYADAFDTLRENADVVADIDRYRQYFDRPVDHELVLTTRAGELPGLIVQIMSLDTLYFPPVEWNDVMPNMNYLATAENVEWILREVGTGRENMDIEWHFDVGDVAKIRLHNDADSFHPMQHPIHLHGQRLLVLSRDGVPNDNLVWKDTALIPVGSTVDLLVELSNPGKWMLHCHIAEHLEAGMMMAFTVEGTDAVAQTARLH